jgi:NADH-quinone oxidoreductase subunit N
MLIAFAAGGAASHHALAFFLVVYVFGNLGAFLVVMAMGVDSPVRMRDFSGLGARNGLIAAAMALCLFSLAGTPPLAGFFGKFALFMAAVDRGYAWLALVALITTVVSVGYYLKIATQMYGGIVTPAVAEAGDDEDDEDGGGALAPISTGRVNVAPALTAAILVCAAAAVVLGVFGVSLLTG